MADEFQHKDPGSELTQAEFITTDGTGHIFQSQATGDILYASSATVLKALPIADNGDVLSLAAGIPAWTAGAAKVTVTDNEATAENNLVTFVAGAAAATGAQSLEMDGHLTYNPSTGTLTATVFVGALTGTASNVTTNANLTGHVTSSGNTTVLGTAAFTSAQLSAALTNETGTGLAVFNGSPVLTTPTIGSFANSAHSHADDAGGSDLLATIAESDGGTNAAKAVTPDALAGSVFGQKTVVLKIISETTVLTTSHTGLFTVPLMLNGMDLVQAEAAIYGVSSSGLVTVQIHNLTDTADMLSTEITIKVGEFISYTADTRSVVNTAGENVATGDRFRIDVDVAGTGTDGLDIILTFEKVD